MSELRQALCCECGNLRTFREGYTPPTWIGEGCHHDPEWHRKSHEGAVERLLAGDERLRKSRDYWVRHADPFERYTFDLKCQPCGQVMKHALVAPPPPAGKKDPSEAWDHGWDDKAGAFMWRRRPGWRPDVETRQTEEALIEDFEQLGVRVYGRCLKGGRAVSITQYLDDGGATRLS